MSGNSKGKIFLRAMIRSLIAGAEELPVVGVPVLMGRVFVEEWIRGLREAQEALPENERPVQLEEASSCEPAEVRALAEGLLSEAAALTTGQREAVLDMATVLPSRIRERTSATLAKAREHGTALQTALPVTNAAPAADRAAFYESLLPVRRPEYRPGDELPNDNPEWRLTELIGAGGFGEVWLARHDYLGETRAVKFCQDDTGAAILCREAENLYKLRTQLPNHPNIVRMLGLQLKREPYWLSFEYVPGGTLESLIRARAFTWREAVEFMAPVWKAMAEVHRLGIVHRDLKPANIFIDGKGHPKIGDFGIGKVLAETEEQERRVRRSQTFTTLGYGSAGYMSREQEQGLPADPTDDTYALGVILWQMIEGALGQTPDYPDDIQDIEAPDAVKRLISECRFSRRDRRPLDAGVLLERLVQMRAKKLKGRSEQESTPLAQEPLRAPKRSLEVGTTFRDSLKDGTEGPLMGVIPAGKFRMGDLTGGNGRDSERPVHEVEISRPFAMGVYPVTFEEYDLFCKTTGRDLPNDEKGWGRGQRPAINVSWKEAQAYCEWLGKQIGQVYRLPTEAEWEYAARAGSEGDWCFGNEESLLKEYAWYGEDWNKGSTHPVGQKKPNAWGLFDIHGNVLEWVEDWGGVYSKDAVTDPQGPRGGSGRVFRGGGWDDSAESCRSAFRSRAGPSYRRDNLGFRLARTYP